MSNDGEGPRAADRVRAGRIAATGFLGLLVFGVGALWAAAVQTRATGSIRSDTAPKPALAGQSEVGIVYQHPFEERGKGGIAATKDHAAQGGVDGLGWVDRDAGIAHIPIEQAMDLILRRGAP